MENSITIYQHPDFTGHSHTFTSEAPRLNKYGFRTSSCIITGELDWQLFDGINYEGKSVILAPGRYKDAKAMGIHNNSVDSLRPLPG